MWEFLKDLIKAPLPIILLVVGVAFGILSLFGKIPGKGSEDRLGTMERMLSGMFGFAFIVAAFVVNASPRHPQIIEEYVAPDIIVIFAVVLGIEIIYLQKEEARLVGQVEDATRRVLTGFAEVFQRAFLMLARCERELYFVNFTLNFGIVHAANVEVLEAYADLTGHKNKFSVAAPERFSISSEETLESSQPYLAKSARK
jgi:hypothetical protein